MSEPKIVVLEDAEAACVRAAEEITHVAGEAICTHAEFRLCLTGGSTPVKTYELLATRFHLSVDWKEVQFFWGDERCVPPDDQASNYGMADRTMLERLELRPEQVHRIRGEDDPEQAARKYEDDLRESFSLDEGEFPRFHLMLLGLGDNAHMASLFPGDPALHEQTRLAVAVNVPAEAARRVSLTVPVISLSERILFIVTGEKKAQAVKNVLEGSRDPERYPAQMALAGQSEVMWIIDQAAASLLTRKS
ncbi:MAG: 6-phosphogluconolactonase [Candidatus Binataceae bacterium]|nr:6-phosphogluconolactonase [Candidatus Binataceae bacterium]